MAGGFSSPETVETESESPDRERSTGSGADKLALASGVIIAGVVLVGVILLLAAVKRGLDLTDESDYIQSEMHAGAYLRASTQFQLVLGPVLSTVRFVWALRATKIIGLLAAHVFFGWAFLTTAPSLIGARFKRSDGIAVIAAVSVGAISISRVQPQTPGYNDVTIFIVVSVSGLLLLLADRRFRGRAELAAWFGVGLIMWFQLVARWPSAVAVIPLAAITLFWTAWQLRQFLRQVAAALAGVVIGALATQLFLAPISDIVHGISQGNNDATAALNYQRSHLLHQYVTNLSDLMRVMSRSFWFLLAAAVAAGLLIAMRRFALPVAIAATAGLVALTPAFIISGRAHGGVEPFGGIGLPLLLARSVLIPMYVVLAILAGVTALIVRRDTRPNWRGLAIVATLLATPFLGGLGSNNPLWYTASLNPGLWIAGALALCALVHHDHGRLLVHGLAFAFAALIAFTAFDGTWHRPYRQLPLAANNVKLTISGPLNGIAVDAFTASLLTDARTAADSVDGDPRPNMIVLPGYQQFNRLGNPGISVASGLRQPLFAWLSAEYFADLSLTDACNDRTRGILLVQDPGQPIDLNRNLTLATACGSRRWTPRAPIGRYVVSYAAPTG